MLAFLLYFSMFKVNLGGYMLTTDIHTHTSSAHGSSTVKEMFEQGKKIGLKVHGFSEHSPRPIGYDYPNEYRDHLQKMLPLYISDVKELQENQTDVKILLGMEVDWLEDEIDFIKETIATYNFDYFIGGIHFIKTWGFDASQADWDILTYSEKANFFKAYYLTMQRMIESELFHTIAHPDLIKIFAIEDFKKWRSEEENIALIRETLALAKKYNIAMEVSTAGLRKPCKEMYPCEEIMHIAKELKLDITLASDGHCVNTIAAYFDELEWYLRKFDIKSYLYFDKGQAVKVDIN